MGKLKILGGQYSEPLSWGEKRKVAHEIISSLTVIPPVGISRVFVMFVGIPGSGKSTASNFLRDKYGFNTVATDRIKSFLMKNKKNFIKPDLFYIQAIVFRYLFKRGVNVTSDSNSNLSKYRYRLKRLAEKYRYNVITLNITCDPEVCLKRIISRDNITDQELIERWRQKIYGVCAETQIPRNAVIIDGTRSVDIVRSSLVNVFEMLVRSGR